MSVIFMIVFLLVAVMIVGLVLLQEGKGGGLTGMSTGMDGVMGAKNPLRRLTAYLFVFFVLMCLGINWYFHQSSTGAALPQGLELPAAPAGPMVVNSPEAAVEAIADALEANAAAPATTPAVPEAAPAVPVFEAPAAPAPEAPVTETPAAAATPAPAAAPATPAPAASEAPAAAEAPAE